MNAKTLHSVAVAAAVLQLSVTHAVNDVKGTFWSTQTDEGGCSLPQTEYGVVDAIALGQENALGDLRWEPGMCGQVVNIRCGGGEPVRAIVASTWDRATGNKSPGVTSCSVTLSTANALKKQTHIVCYNRPSTNPSPYYVNLGVINTGGEVVTSAKLDNVAGQNSNGGWFAFNAQNGKTFGAKSVAEFTFRSGKKSRFLLSHCRTSKSVQIFQ